MMDLNTIHQVNNSAAAYAAYRESADRARGHELETKKPEWFLVAYQGVNFIPGTEAPTVTVVNASVVIPNEYGIMDKPKDISGELWREMLRGDHEVELGYFERVSVIRVFDNDGKLVYEPKED